MLKRQSDIILRPPHPSTTKRQNLVWIIFVGFREKRMQLKRSTALNPFYKNQANFGQGSVFLIFWYFELKFSKNVFRLFLKNSVKVHCSFSKYYWLSIVCLVLHFMNTNYVQQSIKMLWFHLRWPFSVSLGYYENVIPPQAEFVFRLFLIWEHFEAQRSYEIVLMKSPLISDWRVAHTFRILPHPILDFIISCKLVSSRGIFSVIILTHTPPNKALYRVFLLLNSFISHKKCTYFILFEKSFEVLLLIVMSFEL